MCFLVNLFILPPKNPIHPLLVLLHLNRSLIFQLLKIHFFNIICDESFVHYVQENTKIHTSTPQVT